MKILKLFYKIFATIYQIEIFDNYIYKYTNVLLSKKQLLQY